MKSRVCQYTGFQSQTYTLNRYRISYVMSNRF